MEVIVVVVLLLCCCGYRMRVTVLSIVPLNDGMPWPPLKYAASVLTRDTPWGPRTRKVMVGNEESAWWEDGREAWRDGAVCRAINRHQREMRRLETEERIQNLLDEG